MKNIQQALLIEQTDRKLIPFRSLKNFIMPSEGWLYIVRTALGMSMRQLGKRLSISASSVQEMEKREVAGSISLFTLANAAAAMQMKLVYGFVCQEESLESIIEKRAFEIAQEIVGRTHNSMKLEDQENSEQRTKKAVEQKTCEIKNLLPRYLWD